MTIEEMTKKLGAVGATLPGKRVKLAFGHAGQILLDGIAGTVSNNDDAADTTIRISWDDWKALAKGTLDPMSAFMQGRLKVEGDMTNAMQLQAVMSKLRG